MHFCRLFHGGVPFLEHIDEVIEHIRTNFAFVSGGCEFLSEFKSTKFNPTALCTSAEKAKGMSQPFLNVLGNDWATCCGGSRMTFITLLARARMKDVQNLMFLDRLKK
ncbi:hypothetical protein C5167_033817 [Papaver somniferum]|uniref:Uncharacterized protein n=1 Tax=Papaver somniferum TaxID=3469 RepID=A0A4Y7KEA8_PAPSO|nr:hypothetical protein C5167_033817 [Papaver somniferum]